MITATAVLEEFPSKLHRLVDHDERDGDSIGWSQLIAYTLLVGTDLSPRASAQGNSGPPFPTNTASEPAIWRTSFRLLLRNGERSHCGSDGRGSFNDRKRRLR